MQNTLTVLVVRNCFRHCLHLGRRTALVVLLGAAVVTNADSYLGRLAGLVVLVRDTACPGTKGHGLGNGEHSTAIAAVTCLHVETPRMEWLGCRQGVSPPNGESLDD